MANTATLAIQIISDATKAAKGFQETSRQASAMEKNLSRASKVAKVGLLALAAGSLSAAKAAAEDQAAQAKLAGALRKNAGASRGAIAANERWIASLSRATGVADDELRPAMATLVRSTGSVATSQAALKTAMDISAATGKPLQAVSTALAKGYAGQTTAIGRLVPGISQAALKSGDMSKVMAELNKKVGGEAARAAQTSEGQYAKLTNNFNEAKESLGTGLLPILTQLAIVLADAAVWVQENTRTVQILAVTFGALAAGVIGVNTAYKVYRTGALAAAAAQKVLNFALRANPIGLVITAIALLVAGVILAYKKSETFRTVVQAAMAATKVAITAVITVVTTLYNWLKNQLSSIWNTVKTKASDAWDAIVDKVQPVIDAVQNLIDRIRNIKWPSPPQWVKDAGGSLANLLGSYTDYGAAGGASYAMAPAVFTAPGELKAAGPEWLMGRVGSSGGPAYIQINVSGALDADSVARQIENLLAGRGRRLGRFTG